MKIIDTKNLLKESALEEEVDSLLEELEPEATDDREPELEKVEATERAVEADLEADHAEEAEEVSEVEIKESAEGDAAAKPEATVEKKPEEVQPESAAKAAEEHNECGEKKAEEVSEVIVKEEEELEPEDDDEEEEKKELLLEPGEGAAEEDEEELEKAETSEEKKDDDKEEEDKKEDEEKPEESKEEEKEEAEKEHPVDESYSSLFKLLDTLNEEVEALRDGKPEEENIAATEKAVEKDLEGDHAEKAEEVSEVEIKESAEGDAAAKPEATVEKKPEEVQPESAVKAAEEHNECGEKKAEEVSEVEIKESAEGDAAAKPEGAVVEKEPETKEAAGVAGEVEKDLKADHAATVEDVVEVVIEAARRAKANGRALKEDIARELKALLEEEDHGDVKDIMGLGKESADKEYDEDAAENSSEMNGSDKFEDYEDIKGDGADAALSGQLDPEDVLIKEAEENMPQGKKIDPSETVPVGVKRGSAVENTARRQATQQRVEDFKKNLSSIGQSRKNIDIHKESVEYTSLKEACMLDEDYFNTDTYTVDTAESKREKLTEQVSLLMAREAMDPMYDELLKTSLYAQRLEEALVNKYGTGAAKKVSVITETKSE